MKAKPWVLLRFGGVVIVTWTLLLVLPMPIALLPANRQYVLVSPLSAGLCTFFFVFVAPVLALAATKQWIFHGVRPHVLRRDR